MIKAAEKLFRKYFPKQFSKKQYYLSKLLQKKGIEVGGASAFFTSDGLLPLYDYISSIDGCNYSGKTVWEGNIIEGKSYKAGSKTGYQFLAEATNLKIIKDSSYDFLFSCHSLEHVANPILALREWKRILKPDGYLVLVLPHKDRTFDHFRPVTTLNHLIDDFEKGVDEYDQTHFSEIEQLHDCSMEVPIVSKLQLIARLKENYTNRCAHHHVFNARLTAELLDYEGFQILDLSLMYHNIIALAQVSSTNADNSSFLSSSYSAYHDRRYPSDFLNSN